jgi:hypothetical protein
MDTHQLIDGNLLDTGLRVSARCTVYTRDVR